MVKIFKKLNYLSITESKRLVIKSQIYYLLYFKEGSTSKIRSIFDLYFRYDFRSVFIFKIFKSKK